jgi:hypothetical protein
MSQWEGHGGNKKKKNPFKELIGKGRGKTWGGGGELEDCVLLLLRRESADGGMVGD